MKDTIKLEDREILTVAEVQGEPIRHFGVALTVDEAQEFIARDFRVFGDEDGPYLVIRLKGDQTGDRIVDRKRADVEFRPVAWHSGHQEGVICWLEEVV